jgi:hypothetical protein
MMAAVLLETLVLGAGVGLRFLDAWSGQPVIDGLRCTLRRQRDALVLARAAATPSGVHHWPGLRAPWSGAALPPGASPPHGAPLPTLAEILVEDSLGRFLPLRLDWPPQPDRSGAALATSTLLSAPRRLAPPGSAGVAGLCADVNGLAAAWVRLLVTDSAARTTEGMSDAAGRFVLHLPFPRPERRPSGGSPVSPADATPAALVTLRAFHDPGVGDEASAAAARDTAPGQRAAALPPGGAPLVRLWRAQAEVRALARAATSDLLGPLRLEPGRLVVPHTQGLPPNHSELRLAPL